MIFINSYQLKIEPFSYRLYLEGQIEIKSKYKIGESMLVGKLALPNQESVNIDLIPNPRKYCSRNTSIGYYCQIFSLNSFIDLSADKYFHRKIKEYENVPLKFSFDLDTTNLQLFRKENYIFSEGDKSHIYLLSQIKLLKIDTYFKYKNHFEIEHSDQEQTIELPISWNISPKKQTTNFETIKIKTPKYLEINNKDIKDWFSITTKNNDLSVYHVKSSIHLQDHLPIEAASISIKKNHNTTSLYWIGGISKHNNQYIHSLSEPYLLIPIKTKGLLESEIRIIAKNMGFSMNITNPFSTKQHYYLSPTQYIRIKIQSKRDKYFSNLKKFKYIPL